MVTTAFCKFIIGLFVVNLCGCALCYVCEWISAQVEYSREQAQKKYAQERKKREPQRNAERSRLLWSSSPRDRYERQD